MRDHGGAVFLDEEMPCPGAEIAERRSCQHGDRIDGEKAQEQRRSADPRAGAMQQARSFLRVVAEINLPKIVEALCAGVRQLPVLLGPLAGSVSRGFASRQAG